MDITHAAPSSSLLLWLKKFLANHWPQSFSTYSEGGHRSQFGFIMNSRRDYQLIRSQVIGGVHTIIQLAICKVSGSTKQPPLWALHRSHHLLGQCQVIYCFLHPSPPTESDLSVQIGLVSTQSNISNIYSFITPSWIFLFFFTFYYYYFLAQKPHSNHLGLLQDRAS